MDNMQKCLMVWFVGTIGVVGILLLIKAARYRHHADRYEKVVKDIDERLRESKVALDKATTCFHSIFEYIKNRKP